MIKSIPNIFLKDFQHWKKMEYFKTVIYIFLFFNTISLLPAAQEIWATDGIIGTHGWNTSKNFFENNGHVNFLSHPANVKYWWVYILFIIGQLFFLVTGVLRFMPKISSVMIYFFTINLFLKGYLVFTGGEVLLGILLFYMMFIQRSDKPEGGRFSRFLKKNEKKPEFSALQNILNNTFYWAMLIQVCILYFFSAFYKLFDENWLNGEALMYVSRIPEFSSGSFEYLFSENKPLSMIATYGTLFYQGFFPLLVWFKRIKFPFLIVGTIFHLSISFGMGIFSFGLIMTLSYLLFLDLDQIERLKGFFMRKKKLT